MPTPSTRTLVRIARGAYSDLNASIADLDEGEICYATDENKVYVVEGATLTAPPYTELGIAQTWTAAQRGTIVALTPGATVTPDFAAGNNFSLALDQNTTIANPSNVTAGQSGSISVTQDSTARTVAYGSYFYFEGGVPTFGTTTGAVSTLVYYVDSATHITAKLISEPTNA